MRSIRGRKWWAALAAVALVPASPARSAIFWLGGTSKDWGTGSNWQGNVGPSSTDLAYFNDVGTSALPGEVTSTLNADRTTGGLAFANSTGHHHTLDLNGHTLTLAGSLYFNVDTPGNTTTTIRNGTLAFSSPFAEIFVGCAVAGGGSGNVTLAGLAPLNVTVQDFKVGTSTGGGANGAITMANSNTITTQFITVGSAPNDVNANGTIHLGQTNTLLTPQLTISQNYANGLMDIASGGSLTLGSAAQRTNVYLGTAVTNTNSQYGGRLDLTGGTFNGYLGDVVVAQREGGAFGGTVATFNAGSGGSVNIGAAGNTSNFYVGRMLNGGASATGTADFSGLSTLTANVNNFTLGTAQSGSAQGTVKLAVTNTINANNIVIGDNGGGSNALTLGHANTIVTPLFNIGQDASTGVVTLPAGGTLNLGTPAQRTGLYLANSLATTNNIYLGKLDLTGGTLHAYLADLVVAQREGGAAGGTFGTLIGGNGGSVDIGAPGNTANFYVGRTLTGGAYTVGNVDFSGLSTLNASLNEFAIGTTLSGSAQGIVKLAASNTISANSIVVGSGGDSSNTLTLGLNNTILTPQLTIAKDATTATVNIVTGGRLNLGSAAQPVNLTIASAVTNTNNTYAGTLDLSNGTFNAYLGTVVIGQKNPLPGGEQGTLSISASADNVVRANTIALGGTQATGTLNFAGGSLTANSITKGAGTANFNWSGGQLSVGQFGTPSTAFNLNNGGTGTLSPGTSAAPVGVTNVFGTYTQGSAAAMNIDLASNGNDQVNVTGAATLNGTLNLNLSPAVTPSVGQSFLIATYASRTGTFGFVAPPTNLPQNVAFQVDYTSIPTQTSVRFVAPQAQQNWVGGSGTFATAGNWDNNTQPGTASVTAIDNSTASPLTVTVGTSTTVHRINLSGTGGPSNLLVPTGVRLGVANQLAVGGGATLVTSGQIYGNVNVAAGGAVQANGATVTGNVTNQSGGSIQFQGALPSTITGNLASDGAVSLGGGTSVALTGALTGSGTLSIGTSAKLQLGSGGRASSVGGLSILSGGTLDLSNNSLSVSYAGQSDPVADIRTQLLGAYDNGKWDGPGIQSSAVATAVAVHTLGYADSADVASLPANTVLVKYTIPGDTDLNGVVDLADYTAVVRNFGKPGASWSQGDFGYDGAVGLDDYTTVVRAFGGNASALVAAFGAAAAPVPEPTAVALGLAVAVAALPRRRR